MSRLIDEIFTFNEKADLLGNGMDSFKELAYVLEESFEGFEGIYNTADLAGNPFKPGDPEYPTARQLGVSLANSLKDGLDIHDLPQLTDVQEFDKSIDAVVFHIGKLAKMGLTRRQVAEGFSVVAEANMAKVSAPKDSAGKQLKPDGWVGPEDKLQLILNERQKETNADNYKTIR